jgi:hypothetical protein
VERYPGELDALRAENTRLRHLLRLTDEQASAATPDQTAAETPVDMQSTPEAKVRFYADLFRCRSDIYAVRWENPRDGRSGWVPAIRGRWHKGMSRSETSYLPLTDEVVGGTCAASITSACTRWPTTTHAGGFPPISTKTQRCLMRWRI